MRVTQPKVLQQQQSRDAEVQLRKEREDVSKQFREQKQTLSERQRERRERRERMSEAKREAVNQLVREWASRRFAETGVCPNERHCEEARANAADLVEEFAAEFGIADGANGKPRKSKKDGD